MKTVVSLPVSVVRSADRLARRMRKTRSELLGEAVAEYVARHHPRATTSALSGLAKTLDTELEAPASLAARRVLQRSEW